MKNIILKSITFIMTIVWIVSACALDSECWIPFFIALIVSSMWLILFGYANGYFDFGGIE